MGYKLDQFDDDVFVPLEERPKKRRLVRHKVFSSIY
jgi:hypothetical protein